ERYSALFGHPNREPELIVAVVPGEHDVLPDHPNAGAGGAPVEPREVRERDVEIPADPIAAITLRIGTVDGHDEPVQQPFVDDGLLDLRADLHAVGRNRDRGRRRYGADVPKCVEQVPVQKRLAAVEEIDPLQVRTG